MRNILLFGAGKSATYLIDYLLANAVKYKWRLTVVDNDLLLIRSKLGKSYYATAAAFDVKDTERRQSLIREADLVISLLPPHLHIIVAKDCVRFSKHLLTASYLGPEIKKLEKEIKKKGLLFMCEMGLDPGIDHMSAMKLIHSIKRKGGDIHVFKSFCGGLILPQFNNTPWHYKVSWNPRSIVMAGASGAIFKEDGEIREIPYEGLFDHAKTINVPRLGKLDYYPNRDSLKYMQLYGLDGISTFMRATLRFPDFCQGWKAIVRLGLTDDDVKIKTNNLSYLKWSGRYIKPDKKKLPEENIADFLEVKQKSKVMKQLRFLGLMNNERISQGEKTSAAILQSILEDKLQMLPQDQDMIVMQHEISFERRHLSTGMISYMIVTGENNVHTAMAKTVGLPIGILAKLILTGKVRLTGLHIPILPEVYNPVLKELEEHGIRFEERFE